MANFNNCYTEELEVDRDLSDVYECLIGIKHKWYFLGLHLGVETNKLDGFKSQYPQQPEMALLDVLKEWLKQTAKPRTWKVLVKVLRKSSINEESLARSIEMSHHAPGIILLGQVNLIYCFSSAPTSSYCTPYQLSLLCLSETRP